jgi:acyl-CoA thioesterase
MTRNEEQQNEQEPKFAERIEAIKDRDRIIELFGMRIEEASENGARVSAEVKETFLNPHGLAHGAFFFAVADVAFSLAVNAVKDTVAAQFGMNLIRPATLGERVTAECKLVHEGRRVLVVDLVITGPTGKLLAKGQATAMTVERPEAR